VPDRRGSRFVLEVLFLLALAVGLTLADLAPLEIAGVMLVGWVIVAALEWAAWRSEPHYGSGLPPRYYVPRLNLPPPQPLDQVAAGYPEAVRDEAPTWIASAALREEMLGGWPIASPATSSSEAELEQVEVVVEQAAGQTKDPWLVAGLPAAPLGELAAAPPGELAAAPSGELAPEPAPAAPAAEPQPAPKPSLDAALARSVQRVARYSLDPLADPPARRRFARGAGEEPPTVEVPARPGGARALPSRSARED
jgi:hypothetical protein